jgi:hypothetical protein
VVDGDRGLVQKRGDRGREVPVEQGVVGVEGDGADACGIERRTRWYVDLAGLRLGEWLGTCGGYDSLSQRAASLA